MKDGQKQEIWKKGGKYKPVFRSESVRGVRQSSRFSKGFKIRTDKHHIDKLWQEQTRVCESYGKASLLRDELLEVPTERMGTRGLG